MVMESENGVIEMPQVDNSAVVLTNEGEIVDDSGQKAPALNEILEPMAETEHISSSKTKIQATATVPKSKSVKASKEPGTAVGSSKKNKLAKEKPSLTGLAQSPRPNRRALSQSLSFPARGGGSDVMDKSIDKYPVKTATKRTGENGIKSRTQMSDGSQLKNPLNRVISKGVNKNTGNSAQRSSLASISGHCSSVPMKNAMVNSTSDLPLSESAVSAEQKPKPGKTTVPPSEDDDAHSTSSSATPHARRNSCPGFAFRLDERAEKRKEFFLKLEEKIQAKEVEITNMQAKSKESQQAEIKQLRKSMTFKATPMPNFYKEPPPKPDLKKIPTTRPISPKLGRNKSLATEVGTSVHSPGQNSEPSNSPKAFQAKSDKENVSLKKPAKKPQTKLQPNDTEGASIKPKPKINKPERQHSNPVVAGMTKQQDVQPIDRLESNDSGPPKKEEPTTAASPEIMAAEISVGG
ncbi:protein WVD2-like 4 isoform X1 [Cucurbita pepo subsp. pepo]|uniref:protein WVD2-like 4 isoform X1 n=2 Tax=Cucurbita pepo subsp. pepo TaxID=3664 RepID=UPI000C9D61AC|nr:protein WVD2-like 4 isoform X1 [Cucurbita pepo subsp. pepo]